MRLEASCKYLYEDSDIKRIKMSCDEINTNASKHEHNTLKFRYFAMSMVEMGTLSMNVMTRGLYDHKILAKSWIYNISLGTYY